MNHKIVILLTGGTIDSHFDPAADAIKVNQDSVIQQYLQSLKVELDYVAEMICMKDSRDLDDDDRKNLLKSILDRDETHFLITHGTYTMPETAKYLEKQLDEIHGKTIVITGSMQPIVGFSYTDAPFNLGFAIASLLQLDPGIYVAMNGRIFSPQEVRKNVPEARFESSNSD